MTKQMDLERKIGDARRRAFRHWYEDGISELALGGFFLVLGLLSLAAARSATGSMTARATNLLLPLAVIGGVFLVRWVVSRAKEQVTYPRTGYVRFPRRTGRRWVTLGLGALIGAGLGALFASGGLSGNTLLNVVIQSGVLWMVFGYVAFRVRVRRFYILALLSGLAPWMTIGMEPALRDSMVYGSIGVLLLLSGLSSFLRFVRRPLLDVEETIDG